MARILIIGSSIFARWSSIATAVPEHTVSNRAIGGTTAAQWTDWIIQALQDDPAEVVWAYCGSNDINQGYAADTIIRNILHIRAQIPDSIPFAWTGIMKAPQKRPWWDAIDRINASVAQQLSPSDQVFDVNAGLQSDSGMRNELFIDDDLHLSDVGYSYMVEAHRTPLSTWLGAH